MLLVLALWLAGLVDLCSLQSLLIFLELHRALLMLSTPSHQQGALQTQQVPLPVERTFTSISEEGDVSFFGNLSVPQWNNDVSSLFRS